MHTVLSTQRTNEEEACGLKRKGNEEDRKVSSVKRGEGEEIMK